MGKKWRPVVLGGVYPSVQKVMITIGNILILEEELPGSSHVKLISKVLPNW